MCKKLTVALVVLGAMVSASLAGSIRPVYTLENRFPEPWQTEVQMLGRYDRYEENTRYFVRERNEVWGIPSARIGLAENLAATIQAPFGNVDVKEGNSYSGFGDVAFGLQFRAYEDVFGYPFIIPHASVRVQTGDEEKGLGDGASSLTCGVTLGSVMYDDVTLLLDGSYKFIENVNRNYRLTAAAVWDLDEKFSLLIEGYISSEKRDEWDKARHPAFGHLGFNYRALETLEFGMYGGGGTDGAPSVNVTFKTTYRF